MSIRTDGIHAAHPIDAEDALRLRVNKLELLERLADALAHEIKNPLHSMVINLEVLKRRAARVGGEGAEDLQRYAGVLTTELERVNRRIELLLRLSRPARSAEVASLGELLDELMELAQLEARHHEVELELRRGDAPARVRVGREAGRQMILNLVLDALEGSRPGGTIGIVLEQEDGEAHLRVSCRDGAGDHPPGARSEERLAVVRALAASVGGSLRDDGAGDRTLTLPAA